MVNKIIDCASLHCANKLKSRYEDEEDRKRRGMEAELRLENKEFYYWKTFSES